MRILTLGVHPGSVASLGEVGDTGVSLLLLLTVQGAEEIKATIV